MLVWLDETNIEIGDSLAVTISKAIKEVDYIGAIISSNSVKSKWVMKELSLGMTKEIKSKRTVILPILIETCELPDFLQDKLYADFRDLNRYNKELQKLLKAIDIRKNTEQSIKKYGVAIGWPGEGPRISGNNVVLSVSESNALYDRYLKYYDEFIQMENAKDNEYFSVQASLAAILKACTDTYNRAPSEQEIEAFDTELARKFDLFFKFVEIMWEGAMDYSKK